MAEQDQGDRQPDQRPPAYTGPFLFVNKNATNLRSRQREEVFAVRSHAMQIARRSRKSTSRPKSSERESQAQPESTIPASPVSQTGGPSPSAEPIPSIQNILEQQARGVLQYQQRQSQRRQPEPSRSQSATHEFPALSPRSSTLPLSTSNLLPAEHAASLAQLSTAASPGALIPGGASDSAVAAPLAPDTFFNSVLQFWRLCYMSNFWPAHIYFNLSHRAVQFTDGWIRNMVINNPALLHGVFSGALSYITNYLPPTENTPMLWARAIHHYGKCLEETRAQLARPGISTQEALSLIHGMTTFSFHCHDLESCQVHRAASMRLLQSLEGGLESLHPVLKCCLILCDSLTASHVPRRPSMDIESWAPKSWAEETSLRPLDHLFGFDARVYEDTDKVIFLLTDHGDDGEGSQHLLELINWHREALAANELAFAIADTSGSPNISESAGEGGEDRADLIYTWLSLRQYALSCLSSHMYMDFLESENPEQSLLAQILRVFHSSIVLATSYMFQFVMRYGMNAPSMAYIPYHHLRTRLDLLMTLMSQYRRIQAPGAGEGRGGRGPTNPVPTDALLFLFFAGAVVEESDGPNRVQAPHHITRAGVIPSPSVEHPGDIINARWFSVHFAMVLQRLNIEAWENVRRVLQRFVYAERVLDRFLQVLVTRKLEFLAALVMGLPDHVPAGASEGVAGAGFFGGLGVAGSTRPGPSSPPQRRPLPSRQSSFQMPAQHQPLLQQAGMSIPMALPVSPSAHNLDDGLDSLPLFGPTPVTLSAAVPNAAADWWQDMGYEMGVQEDFSMDLDMNLGMGTGLDTLPDVQMHGEDLGEHEDMQAEKRREQG
ncbi:uncharacterized protein Z520_01114 [Fonsecaea multimorphosa CBS 102226]|uniref:Transcription factor domain-containing protein n=1 Tax=Fonsecaea multimorphosa CBS 102226 TaxID=1442371 RepID=A0A0D2L0T0_9EURO|nr:uncharacterized protein Z520_01114 [Fonsecaea multimorphosa CBS 102226]KIY02649.1 hypothetical protein Z520_01114 [Fonsecaea multimorphosa CBS 102226]OAL31512.1 hypothetical protein AYO22_01104 [Fonsecaea multimorphosa]